jgi:hypothetical protein
VGQSAAQQPGGLGGAGLGPEGKTERRSGAPPPTAGVRTEGDLLAERRARRAADSPESAMIRRAEAAEATVQSLETHVATLQQRMQETEEEKRRLSELLEAERASLATDPGQGHTGFPPAGPGGPPPQRGLEQELRRVKQREYAEQQLRVEAENRWIDLDRRSRVEIERLNDRLSASERDARKLAARLESVQRELAEAEQSAATERVAVRRAERELQVRLSELEDRAVEIHRGLDAERAARERSERELESMRRGHREVEGLVGELRDVVARLATRARAQRPHEPVGSPDPPSIAAATRPERDVLAGGEPDGNDPASSASSGAGTARGGEMADALAAAVERLRARAQDESDAPANAKEARDDPGIALAAPPGAPGANPSQNKHSMSLLARWRIRRKDRRERRSAVAEPPSMQSQ